MLHLLLHGVFSVLDEVPEPFGAACRSSTVRCSARDMLVDQFWDESGRLDHTFCITLPGTCCEISCWQVSFIRNLSGFLEKNQGVSEQLHFMLCSFIHH